MRSLKSLPACAPAAFRACGQHGPWNSTHTLDEAQGHPSTPSGALAAVELCSGRSWLWQSQAGCCHPASCMAASVRACTCMRPPAALLESTWPARAWTYALNRNRDGGQCRQEPHAHGAHDEGRILHAASQAGQTVQGTRGRDHAPGADIADGGLDAHAAVHAGRYAPCTDQCALARGLMLVSDRIQAGEFSYKLRSQTVRLAGTDAVCLPDFQVLLLPVLACAAGLGQEAPGCPLLG